MKNELRHTVQGIGAKGGELGLNEIGTGVQCRG